MDEKRSQSERFIETAKMLGCNESEEPFDSALRTIAKHKPKPDEGKAEKRIRKPGR